MVERPGLAVIALLVPELSLRGVGVMLENRVDVLGLVMTERRQIRDITMVLSSAPRTRVGGSWDRQRSPGR